MDIIYTDNAKRDIAYWKEINDIKIQSRIIILIKSIEENPFKGIGKPEPLKGNLAGCWSRRITKEHRIIYQLIANEIWILSLRHHYPKL